MTYVDVHAHLDFDVFDQTREQLIKQLEENNITVLTNTLNPKNYEETKELFKNAKNIHVCPGLYPQEAEKIEEQNFKNYLKQIKKEKNQIKAIGEIGLDKHHTKDENAFTIQKQRFKKILDLAVEIDKPVIIHSRKAEPETLEILSEYVKKHNFKKIDLHCFAGKKKHLKTIKELGIYCSIPLQVIKTQSFQILVENIPIKQLLVETDSPFLNPEEFPNTPLTIPRIYEKIAEIKGYEKEEIKNIIYNNYQRFIM